MRHSRTALPIDPLWQCLCPAWYQPQVLRTSAALTLRRTRPRALQPISSHISNTRYVSRKTAFDLHTSFKAAGGGFQPRKPKSQSQPEPGAEAVHLEQESTSFLYGRLGIAAIEGNAQLCRRIAEYLVKERRETPNLQLYNALITSNVSPGDGAAWRVSELLDEMEKERIQPDAGTCNAVLKVLGVHLDHLLRADILDYMQRRWFAVSEDAAHSVVAGLLREGLFEQALHRVEGMQGQMRVDNWLWDMMVYVFCAAGEIDEAYRIICSRHDAGQIIDRSLWYHLLDKASEARHHDATSMVWTNQVELGYLNPSSGVCLNILATAARAGDAAMGTEVFAHLSKRGTAFQPIHYELLISTYLAHDPPDLTRAISILTIMPLEKLEPTVVETRPLYDYMRDKPALVGEAFAHVQELHSQDRKIPIALLNLLIECYVEQRNLPAAMNIYKLIHTFNPIKQGLQKSFANIETFNLLLKGCRLADPPDAQQASFLVSELLALRATPTFITYDRLILVYVEAAKVALERAAAPDADSQWAQTSQAKGVELLDWAFRHFADMQPLGWMPRFGTIELLAIQLAGVGDKRCWDILQIAEDMREKIEGFEAKGKWLRKNVETAWEEFGQHSEMSDFERFSQGSA